jgi:6-phosphogluconate dehydrogenase
MQLGMVGLGRMGGNMVRRLMRGGHECVVSDLSPQNVNDYVKEGATGSTSLDDFVSKLKPPRAAWVMVPAGGPTESTVMALGQRFERGDVIIDGGNSYFKDDVRRAQMLKDRGIHYVDVGTSGGVWGLERGYCMMIGGPKEAVERLDPIFRTLAPGRGDIPRTPGREKLGGTAELGYLYCGPSGAGHFVKMVHNGIEYGLMQAYAEGFDIFRNASSPSLAPEHRYDLNLADIAEVWRRGSVISSWLLDLTAIALAENPALTEYTGYVQDSGEGRWTVMAAIDEAVPCEVLSAALYTRFRSRQEHTFAEKVLSAMRQKFGGHVEQHVTEKKEVAS